MHNVQSVIDSIESIKFKGGSEENLSFEEVMGCLYRLKEFEDTGMEPSVFKAYKRYFGDVVIPGDTSQLYDVFKNHKLYMYSLDGVHWKKVPYDIIEKYNKHLIFRKIPCGVTIGITDEIHNSPEKYLFSKDIGHTWEPLINDKGKVNNKILSGNCEYIWFKSRP